MLTRLITACVFAPVRVAVTERREPDRVIFFVKPLLVRPSVNTSYITLLGLPWRVKS